MKFKTSLVIACTVSLILLLESYVITQISERAVEEQLKDRALDAATNLRDYLRSPEALQRNELSPSVELDNFIHNLLQDRRDFVKIAVYAVSGKQRRHIALESSFEFKLDDNLYDQALRDRRPVRKFINLAEAERGWTVVVPLLGYRDEPLGVFSVTISLNDVDAMAQRQTKWTSLSAGISILFLTLVLIRYLNRSVSNPIDAIVAAMERVRAGDLKAQAKVWTGDEIGELAKNFNTMVAKLKEEDEKIANFNKELQVRIAEAVSELNERNQDLMQMTENLFETQIELSRLETLASMGHLAASVAHEVGTPLHSISGHVQLLMERESLPSDVLEKLKIIQIQIIRLTEIINQTLNTTKLPAPDFEPVDVNAIIRDICNLIQPGLRKKNVEITAALADSLAPVSADSNQLQQVLLNLVTNSVEAMPHGGRLCITTRMHWPNGSPMAFAEGVGAAAESSGLVEITFEDTGIGIAPQDLRSIFKPFFSTKNNRKSAGLGLAICRAIVKHHKGDIEVHSQVGRGTKFTIQLPALIQRQPV